MPRATHEAHVGYRDAVKAFRAKYVGGGGDCRSRRSLPPGGIVDQSRRKRRRAMLCVVRRHDGLSPFHCEYPRQRPALVI